MLLVLIFFVSLQLNLKRRKISFMRVELFIAKRLLKSKEQRFSRPIIQLAIVSVSLCVALMIIAVAVMMGFKQEITNKMVGFGAHIVITNFEMSDSYEVNPIEKNPDYFIALKNISGINAVRPYSMKIGLIKTDDQNQGFVLKGVDNYYDTTFFKENLIAGTLPVFSDTVVSNDVLVSGMMAKKLDLTVGAKLRAYFISGDQVRARAFTVKGIYESGMQMYDEKFVIGDIRHIQKIAGWDENKIDGFEISIKHIDNIDKIAAEINNVLPYQQHATTVKERNPDIFGWLELTNVNVVVILTLMAIVAAITMISVFLIQMIEKTTLVGLLKSFGSTNASLNKIFLMLSSYIVCSGIILGNIIALVLCFLQKYFGIIKINKEIYYLSEIPIVLNALPIVIINILTFLCCFAAMFLPTLLMSKISPIKTIKFD